MQQYEKKKTNKKKHKNVHVNLTKNTSSTCRHISYKFCLIYVRFCGLNKTKTLTFVLIYL